MRDKTIRQLISRYRGIEEAQIYSDYQLQSPKILASTAKEMISNVPPSFGACALISSMWADILRSKHNIPAIVVAGDLKISGATIFKCKKNLPSGGRSGKFTGGKWNGHCWIEIDGYIGDLTIFRTAYSLDGPSILKEFVLTNFGQGRAGFLSKADEVPNGMKYIPKYVLKDNQVFGLVNGLCYQLEEFAKTGQIPVFE
ncbi:MAG: hypothetical protein ACRBB6_15015 [Neptuniibacter sp.]